MLDFNFEFILKLLYLTSLIQLIKFIKYILSRALSMIFPGDSNTLDYQVT